MKRPLLLALGLVAAAAAALTPAQIDMLQAIAKSRLQELNLEQVRGTAAPHAGAPFFPNRPAPSRSSRRSTRSSTTTAAARSPSTR